MSDHFKADQSDSYHTDSYHASQTEFTLFVHELQSLRQQAHVIYALRHKQTFIKPWSLAGVIKTYEESWSLKQVIYFQ